jgi:hypothetical protein
MAQAAVIAALLTQACSGDYAVTSLAGFSGEFSAAPVGAWRARRQYDVGSQAHLEN